MGLQTSVRADQATGVVGEIIYSGPHRAIAGILNTSTASNNVIGRAFTHVAANDLQVAAGGTGVFAGILISPKELTTSGTTTGALEATTTLPNNTTVELLRMGYVIVSLSGDSAIGDDVCYVDATGALFAVDPGAAAGAGNTKIANAKIAYYNTTGAGLAVVCLTN